ncbi:NAD-dependent epimerase/dehydratase family protein [Candidatus Pacearchaeota archaeon]|nr:NAD-dependent epimerase/dehydratase family protein [Candidatus Pacearchaeota archaeon]
MKLDNKILITGSSGIIGGIITEYLKKDGYIVTELDIKNQDNNVDILLYDIFPYFYNVNTVIHLAANPNPFIGKIEADKNIEITKRVIDACQGSRTVRRIINASSINVYPYRTIDRITKETPLTSNIHFNPKGYYGKAKIECERLFEEFCRNNNLYLLNLRLGWVTKNDLHPPNNEPAHTRDIEVALKHEDLKKIISRAINYKGIGNYVCVSKRNGFIDDSILFPL